RFEVHFLTTKITKTTKTTKITKTTKLQRRLMRSTSCLSAVLLSIALGAGVVLARAAQTSPSHDYPVTPVPFTAVHLHDAFWAPRIETNRQVTIPFAFQQCELSGRVDNFERAAKALRGETL